MRPSLEALEGRALLTTFTVWKYGADDGSPHTLSWAVAQANLVGSGPDTIDFDASVFNVPRTITLAGAELALTDAATTTVTGPGAGLLAVSGGGLSRVFRIAAGASADLSGLTITGGNAPLFGSAGGGLLNLGAATLAGVTFSGNRASIFGGGLSNSGTATLTDVTFSGNRARDGFGGGLYNDGTAKLTGGTFGGNQAEDRGGGLYNAGTATLTGVIFSANSTDLSSGGGLYNAGMVTLTGATFSGNSAPNGADGGGGLYNGGTANLTDATFNGNSTGSGKGGGLSNFGTATLAGATFSGNSAWSGGGGLYNAGAAALTNATFGGNSAMYDGGGLANAGTATLTNVTISGNRALVGKGGGLLNTGAGTATLTNTIVAANTAPTAPDVSGALEPASTNNLVGGDPKLAPLGAYGGPTQTMALLPGSPALNAGTSAGAPATDQRGVARPLGPAVDIGAYESRGFTLAAVAGSTPQAQVVGLAFASPLAVTLSETGGSPLPGGSVGFAVTPAASGASATLSGASATTNAAGVASITATANTVAGGPYAVTASVGVGSNTVAFALTNTPDAPASVTIVSGSGQSATVGTAFGSPLVVVVADRYGNPVPSVPVAFAPAPAGLASAILAGSPATTGADGRASVTAAANAFPGTYVVNATVVGSTPTPATFTLTNLYRVVPTFNAGHPVNAGATLPITLRLTDANGVNLGSPSLPVTAVDVISQTGVIRPPSAPGNSQPGDLFRYEPTTGTYRFNLKTGKGWTPGRYTLRFRVGTGSTLYRVTFNVRSVTFNIC